MPAYRRETTSKYRRGGSTHRVLAPLVGLLLLASACSSATVAEPESGFINEPDATTTIQPPVTTTVTVEETGPSTTITTTTIASEASTDPSTIEIDESRLTYAEPGTVEADVEMSLHIAFEAMDEALTAGNGELPLLLDHFEFGPLLDVQGYITRMNGNDYDIVVEPATTRWVESIELGLTDGEPAVAFVTYCELYVESVTSGDEVLHDADEYSLLVERQLLPADGGWWVLTGGDGEIDYDEGAAGCVLSHQ